MFIVYKSDLVIQMYCKSWLFESGLLKLWALLTRESSQLVSPALETCWSRKRSLPQSGHSQLAGRKTQHPELSAQKHTMRNICLQEKAIYANQRFYHWICLLVSCLTWKPSTLMKSMMVWSTRRRTSPVMSSTRQRTVRLELSARSVTILSPDRTLER